jgi:HlyD family secretion protein
LRKTEVGMRVTINSPLLDKKMNGLIAHVDKYPTKEPSLHQESLFPFQVMMQPTERDEIPLVMGSKVDLTVITNESIGVPTVPTKIVHSKTKPYLFKLTEKGYVNKEYLTVGLSADKKVEIVEGVVKGEAVLLTPRTIPKNHSTFITPIQTEKLAFSAYKKITIGEKWRYFLVGMLEK